MSRRFIHELHLTNLLSFGPDSEPLELQSLNVLIGPNGAGKSNLMEAISLLRAAPTNLSAPVKETGVKDWLWKGKKNPTATIEAVIENPEHEEMPLRHSFSFIEHGQRFEITAEKIENRDPYPNHNIPYYYYKNEAGFIRLHEKDGNGDLEPEGNEDKRTLRRENINPEESILSQVKDPERYPYFSYLNEQYGKIQLYREWSFGRYTPPRQPQKADASSLYLSEMGENLPLVLNALRPHAKEKLIKALSKLYPGIDDFNVQIVGGWVQLFLEEGKFSIPATRLSDGTLRFLSLLAILLHPEPPSLVCIEEPELGLHPDALPTVANLLVDASERTQLIVTTHSEIIVDALTTKPESIVVCERMRGQTQMERLNPDDLKEWLENYRLGELWTKGELGGVRF
jgi:predicted ATPase